MFANLFNHAKPLLLTAGTAGVLLTILAPYGTNVMNIYLRGTYWIGLCIAGGLGASIADVIGRPHRSSWTQALKQSIGGTIVVFTLLCALRVTLSGWPSASYYIIMLFYVWIISMIISLSLIHISEPTRPY